METMPIGQGQNDQNSEINNSVGVSPTSDQMQNLIMLVHSLAKLTAPRGPAIVCDGVYSRSEVESLLGISNTTMSAWIEFNGLTPWQPGTKESYFYGQDVIDWMRAHKDGITRPKTAKAKAAARKKPK